jgi:hypothetical protein
MYVYVYVEGDVMMMVHDEKIQEGGGRARPWKGAGARLSNQSLNHEQASNTV